MALQATNLQFDYAKYGFRDEEKYVFKSGKGLNEGVVRELSGMKGEPEWMLKRRLQALQIFNSKPVPLKGMWANEELAELDYENIHYFVRAGDKPQTDWDAVPADIKNAALNTAVWSGGSFVYVPKGVHVDIPLQAYFRINAENMGQFERTLII